MLYTLGAALNSLDRQDEAVEALTEAEQLYLAVSYPDGPLLAADVRLRRARAHALGGRGASAVVDAQRSIVAYVRRSHPDRMDEAYINLARTMMMASDILGAYSDPEVGLAAAQEGTSWAVRAINTSAHELDQPLLQALVLEAGVRLGLEAHYLSAFVLDETLDRGGPVGADPVDLDALGQQWCPLLAALADVVHAERPCGVPPDALRPEA